MNDCYSCGWVGSDYELRPYDDHTSTSYCCPMCGSTEVYQRPEEEDLDECA